MGCTGSTNAMQPIDSKRPLRMVKGLEMNGDLPSPVAFVVPLAEEDNNSTKKDPPVRLHQFSPPVLTHKMLQDKLAEAEQRRLQILNERIESAKTLMKPKNGNGVAKMEKTVPAQ